MAALNVPTGTVVVRNFIAGHSTLAAANRKNKAAATAAVLPEHLLIKRKGVQAAIGTEPL